jgi:hypothetical protein
MNLSSPVQDIFGQVENIKNQYREENARISKHFEDHQVGVAFSFSNVLM